MQKIGKALQSPGLPYDLFVSASGFFYHFFAYILETVSGDSSWPLLSLSQAWTPLLRKLMSTELLPLTETAFKTLQIGH